MEAKEELYEERKLSPKATFRFNEKEMSSLLEKDGANLGKTFDGARGITRGISIIRKEGLIIFDFIDLEQRKKFFGKEFLFCGDGRKLIPKEIEKKNVFVYLPDMTAAPSEEEVKEAIVKNFEGAELKWFTKNNIGGFWYGSGNGQIAVPTIPKEMPNHVIVGGRRIPAVFTTGAEMWRLREERKKRKEKISVGTPEERQRIDKEKRKEDMHDEQEKITEKNRKNKNGKDKPEQPKEGNTSKGQGIPEKKDKGNKSGRKSGTMNNQKISNEEAQEVVEKNDENEREESDEEMTDTRSLVERVAALTPGRSLTNRSLPYSDRSPIDGALNNPNKIPRDTSPFGGTLGSFQFSFESPFQMNQAAGKKNALPGTLSLQPKNPNEKKTN